MTYRWAGLVLMVLAACGDQTPPAHADASIDAVPIDAPGPPTMLTVTPNGPNASFIHVTSSPAGIDCGGTGTACTASFPRGSTISLTGDSGGHCFSWTYSSCAPGGTSICMFTLTADTTVTVGCASAAN